ncbi:hypothetical protein [Leptospira haakeii]|uniref:Uncharacterized protein n=1 Tax=Leptospira haakeii TaxID=2023198 RepID=A0ABX4PJL3_9LEPT|nr:hypothetical protein [Leptospira haakeii]PKA15798.1 hypothetical protein CH363_12385 [Leptospira haakeii]PKA18669.1 hypothetical protein CH377_15980 [Leptospira haakeii]
MRSTSKFRVLIFLFLFAAIVFCFYFIFSESDPDSSFNSKVREPSEEQFSFAETLDDSFLAEEIPENSSDKDFSDDFVLTELVGFPFLSKTREIFENLGRNIFRPDPNHAEMVKSFHEKLEYLENKRSFTGLNTFEEEEYILLQLRKKKDLREILYKTFEKLKEELSETRKKEFRTELESLDRSISELSKKNGNL